MLEAEARLLASGIEWFDKWNSDSVSKFADCPSCYFESSDIAVDSGHIHQVQYFSGPKPASSMQKCLEAGTALVCLHGFGSGVGIYYSALPALRAAWDGPVFALDWFGCSLSSRPKWELGYGRDADAAEIERFFLEPLEQWRVATGVEHMVIVGHSLGGYLGGCYAACFPQHVEHLILVSPAGVSGKEDRREQDNLPLFASRLGDLIWNRGGINPLMGIWRLSRMIGRLPLRRWFASFREASWLSRELLVEYFYQSTLQGEVSGGHCLTGLLDLRDARRPLSARLCACPSFTFIYGSRDHLLELGAPGRLALSRAIGKNPPLVRVAGAGHDMMIDNPVGFAEAVIGSIRMQIASEVIFGEAALARELSQDSGIRNVSRL